MNNEVLNSLIADAVYESILLLHRRHPQWIQEKLRSYPWERDDFKDKFITQLSHKLSLNTETDNNLNRLLAVIRPFFMKDFFASDYYIDLTIQIRDITKPPLIFFDNQSLNYSSLILLDVENLSVDDKIEKILEKVSTYPIQIKFAFANWRNLGKKDIELHEKGYHLIHVPPGKNSVDLKMTSLGALIPLQYRNIKEAFVCSSDHDLHHLSNSLVSHGLKVYWVSRQKNELTVKDVQTSNQQQYSLLALPPMISLEDFIKYLKNIIKQECQNSPWIKLSKLSALFNENHGYTITQIVNHHLPGKRARDIFLEYKNEFVIHQVNDSSEIYVSLFALDSVNLEAPIQNQKKEITKFKMSLPEFEILIYKIIKELLASSQKKYVYFADIASEFFKHYSLPITQVTQELGLGKNLPKALKTFKKIKITQVNNSYQVTLNPP